jgi:hypothetical protein
MQIVVAVMLMVGPSSLPPSLRHGAASRFEAARALKRVCLRSSPANLPGARYFFEASAARHRYQEAVVRQGRQISPWRRISFGAGNDRLL